jgi:O-antigen/teichoic acid export membrane protein
MMVGLAVVARPVVLVLFGDKWLPCVPYLQILSLMGVFWPWAVINLNVLTATGRSDLFLRLDVTKRILLGLGLLISYRMSVTAMAWALLIVCAVGVFINTYYSKTLIGYGPLNQLRDIAPYGAISGMMGVVAWAAGELFSNSPVLQLSVAVTSGAAFYCATCYIFRLQGYRSAVASGLGALSSIIGRGASEVVTASNS